LTPTRQEFLYFSLPEKILFYVLVYSSLGYMAWQFATPYRLAQMGRPSETPPAKKDRLIGWISNVCVFVLAQKKVRSSRKTGGAPMHLAIFYGFMTLLVATTLLGINTYSPWKFHRGLYFLIYEQVTDWMGLVFLIGIGWAAVRRVWLATRPLRPQANTPSDFWSLALLGVLGLTGFWVEAARISVEPRPWDWTDPVGGLWGHAQGDWSALPYKAVLYLSIWWLHALLVCLFFCVLPRMRLRHIIFAIASVAGKPDRPMGKLRLITMEEVEQTEQVGAKVAPDYSRWHLLSLDACMECGRCTEVCPAWLAGKVLNPRRVVQDVRTALRSGAELAPLIGEDALWACTTCNACVEACPVQIRQVDLIVDARRNLVSEGRLSGSGAVMLRQTSSTESAWGSSRSSREDWMTGLEIPLCRDRPNFEWLLWVGCAGATDPSAIKTTQAVAELLKQAQVNFACLGNEEACTGDPARRIGEEFLFQEMGQKNVSAFQRYGVKKVVTACPHCFNSLKNEYGDLGAEIEVVHHTQLLSRLIRKGALLAAKAPAGGLTLHDPCYLSRVNDDPESPRELVEGPLAEPAHRAKKTLCCGAGGGRMWMEEDPSLRPSNRRADEMVATGAQTVAVACPFCRIMLGDSLKQTKGGAELNLVDLAELLVQSNRENANPHELGKSKT
jgi:Fe-S oxidoreductase